MEVLTRLFLLEGIGAGSSSTVESSMAGLLMVADAAQHCSSGLPAVSAAADGTHGKSLGRCGHGDLEV